MKRKPKSIGKRLADIDSGLITLDGYDDCILGISSRFGSEPVICYDKEAMIRKLMVGGMTEEEAEEFFQFNIIGGWFGDRTPCFMNWMTPYLNGCLPVMDEVDEEENSSNE